MESGDILYFMQFCAVMSASISVMHNYNHYGNRLVNSVTVSHSFSQVRKSINSKQAHQTVMHLQYIINQSVNLASKSNQTNPKQIQQIKQLNQTNQWVCHVSNALKTVSRSVSESWQAINHAIENKMCNQLINQSINQSCNQSSNQSCQSFNHAINQVNTNQAMNNQSSKQAIDI